MNWFSNLLALFNSRKPAAKITLTNSESWLPAYNGEHREDRVTQEVPVLKDLAPNMFDFCAGEPTKKEIPLKKRLIKNVITCRSASGLYEAVVELPVGIDPEPIKDAIQSLLLAPWTGK